MSDLLDQQQKFVRDLGALISYVYNPDNFWGVALTIGEGYRSDGHGHAPNSLHYIRLAQDLNLFVDGVYVIGDHPVWHQLADHWKGLDVNNAWGGDFDTKDYNHFSSKRGGEQ